MQDKIKRSLLEWVIIISVLGILSSGWWIWYDNSIVQPAKASDGLFVNLDGHVSIPYFLLGVDRSASMEHPESDPDNYEKEALKQVVRLIYWNGRYLKNATGNYPRIKITTFSGSPVTILPKGNWITLASKDDVFALDSKIDNALNVRDGQFTDINAFIDFVEKSWNEIPRTLGDGKNVHSTAMVVILFTDGEIYPNFMNSINHRTRTKWKKFTKKAVELAQNYFNDENLMLFKDKIRETAWFDPIEWSKIHHVNRGFASKFYTMNERYGIQDKNNFSYARNEVQKKLKRRLFKLNFPPFRLNIIALLKGEGRQKEESYLKNWSKKLGFYYLIQDTRNLGNVFVDIMSKYLNSYSETFAVSGAKVFEPFSKDIEAAELTIVFPEKIAYKDQERFVQLYSPTGTLVKAELNQGLELSRSYHISVKDYDDFYDMPGWKLSVNPIQVNNKIYERIKCYLVTIHRYVFNVQQDTTYRSANYVRYRARLINVKNSEVLSFKKLLNPLQIKVKCLSGQKSLPPVKLSTNMKQSSINIDFINWPAGKYEIRFKLLKGRLRGDNIPFREQTVTKKTSIGENIVVQDESGKRITYILFNNIDRK